jgi:hypothetical protein
MVRALVAQVRPALAAWLLLTLPTGCHHETAVGHAQPWRRVA